MNVDGLPPALASAAYEVAVVGKVLDANKEQGQQALELIQAATAPVATVRHGNLGHHLNIVA